MTDNFYRSFEDKHRGSRELIKSRLLAYIPLIEAIKKIYPNAKAIDLGCGRGEWLELLLDVGIDSHGVDIDNGMLSICRDMGLQVETGEAVDYLKQLPDESQAIVSGFHIAEHIPFADLQALVQEALRVLKPAGLLILETPNPENIVVGTANFYLDPTHQRPIPPPLLAFLADFYGFYRTQVLRLQEPVTTASNHAPKLMDVLYGVSPDYAVVAQKWGELESLQVFAESFETERGVTLYKAATNYDEQLQVQFNQAINLAKQGEDVVKQTSVTVSNLQEMLQEAEAKITAMSLLLDKNDSEIKRLIASFGGLEARMGQQLALAQEAEASVEHMSSLMQQAVNNREEIYLSRSWRITKPLRWIGFQVRLLEQHGPVMRLKALVKKCAKPITRYCFGFVTKRPLLRQYCLITVKRLGLYTWLRSKYLKIHQISLSDYQISGLTPSPQPENFHMSVQAQRVYFDLLAAIEKHKGRG